MSDEDAPAGDEAATDPRAVAAAIDGPVLLFDGVCNLCNGFVRFVVRYDAAGSIRFAPLQSEIGRAFLDRFDLPTEQFDSVVLVDDDDYYTKSEAALRVARYLDGPWSLATALRIVPRGIRDRAYDLVADNRYRVFGKKDHCPIPDPETRRRFLERSFDIEG